MIVIREFIPYNVSIFYREYLDTLRTNGALSSSLLYGDPCYDTLMLLSTEPTSAAINKKLVPLFSEARAYKNGDYVLPHKHLDHCEYTVSLCLGGVYEKLWPLWLMERDSPNPPFLAALNPGDAVIYEGNKYLHWRDDFEGISHYQLEMHYADAEGAFASKKYDERFYIGMKKQNEESI